MKKHIFFLFLTIAATSLVAQPTISGNWLRAQGQINYELTLDGYGHRYQNGEEVKYWIRDGKYFEDLGDTIYTYKYVLDGNILTLSEGGIEGELKLIRGQMGYWGPAGTQDARLVGMWVDETDTFAFQADGNGQLAGKPFKYKAGGQLLTVEYSFWEGYYYAYAIHGEFLLLSAGNQIYRLEKIPGSGATQMDIPLTPPADAEGIVGTWTSYGEETVEEAIEQEGNVFNRNISLDKLGNIVFSYAEHGSYTGTYKYDGERLLLNIPGIARSILKLERLNHPQTGAPLILMNGDAFVGRYGHAPW